MKDRMSHNVGLISNIVGKVERHKGKLTIKLNSFGGGYDAIKGNKYNGQGGIVFDNDEIALDLLNVLQEHFDNHKITVAKTVYGWFYSLVRSIKLSIEVHFIKRKWKKEKAERDSK
jgi:hypothetical protein